MEFYRLIYTTNTHMSLMDNELVLDKLRVRTLLQTYPFIYICVTSSIFNLYKQ